MRRQAQHENKTPIFHSEEQRDEDVVFHQCISALKG